MIQIFSFQRGSTQDPRLDYMNSMTGHKVVFENISIVMSSVCTRQTDP